MSNKIIIFLLVLAVLSYTAANDDKNIENCLNPGSRPTAFHNQEYVKKGEFSKYQEETVRVPLNGFTPSPITCITVVNLLTDAEGGFPRILDGGIGFNYVVFHFKSELSKGYDFQVTVYYDGA